MSSNKPRRHRPRRRKPLKHFLELGDSEVEITKIESVNSSGKKFIHFDEMDDGTWRLIYSKNTLSNDNMVARVVEDITL